MSNKDQKNDHEMLIERIKMLIEESKETQKAFAERCDVSPNTLSSFLTRSKIISMDLIEKIADANNVSIDWLFGRADVREISRKKADDYAADYSKLEYGYVCNILAYLSALNYLQIVKTADGVILRVHDECISKFLDTLQQLARMATANCSICAALKTWVDDAFNNDVRLSSFGVSLDKIDKYGDAFPWKYFLKNHGNVEFEFSDSEWCDDSPAYEWDTNHDNASMCGRPSFETYDHYESLNDGIVGYYNHKYPYPEPPKRLTDTTDDIDISNFMSIPARIDEKLPLDD